MTHTLQKNNKNTAQVNKVGAPKVFVGLSGGVDSSVSAAFLKEAGYDVTGVFIKVWHPDFLPCNWKRDREDAMRVCMQLGIPFRELDLEDVYKREVVDYMISEYETGRTPNPDVMCNRHVKFGAFWSWAQKKGADYVATGHYASISYNPKIERYDLKMGGDAVKDQTYFLWTLTQDDLSHVLFPIGEMSKDTVRSEAKERKLLTANKHDSQGLCFVGKIDMKDFLSKFLPTEKGAVLNESGEIIGEHDGVHFYTIGQRKGFTIARKGTESRPSYIVAKDVKSNTLTVRESEAPVSAYAHIILENVQWISEAPQEGTYKARLRHGQKLADVSLNRTGKEVLVIFEHPQHGAAPGQSLVLYEDDVCLGGGIIAVVS